MTTPGPTVQICTALLCFLPIGSTRAQVLDGHCVVGTRNNSAFPGVHGLYIAHPRTPGFFEPVVGWPPTVSPPALQPRAVALLPSGDILLGDSGMGLCSVYLLRMRGFAIAQVRRFPLGSSNLIGGGIVDIAVRDDRTAYVATNFILGTANTIQRLDVVTGNFTQVLARSGFSTLTAIAYDPAVGRLYSATTFSGSTSFAGSMSVRLPFEIQGMEVDGNGDLLCASSYCIYRVTPAGVATLAFPCTSGLLQGIALERTTGAVFVCRAQSSTELRRFGSSGQTVLATTTPAGGFPGHLSSVTVAPNPEPYGQPSGAGPFAWSSVPRADGLPVAGAQWTLVTDWLGPQATWSAVGFALDRGAAPFPRLGIDVLVDPATSLGWLGMTPDASQGQSRRVVILPPGLGGLRGHAQSFHITAAGGFGASDGMRFVVL